ncbi:unnamed protein product [Cladocopium goreaui]|uniref:C3H1-type domain-containing protein n=1 Tax=Cladocopium goreaui TaxID=2562237 RepID=A0A9P1C9P4_9DINO|nr:unnamed protein product [Cladocopium goreaui]
MGDHRDRPQGLCGFSHVGPPGSRGVVDVAQIETKEQCWYFLRGCCSKGLACPYAHHEPYQEANYQQGLQQLLQQPLDCDPNSLVLGVEEMKVPARFARALIGYGGENIKLLQQVTGCRAYLEAAKDAEGEDGFRILKIQGIPLQRAHCKELVQSHYASAQQAKMLKYDNHSATDPLYTAVKVALSAHGAEDLEDDLELAKIRSKITQFARKCGEGVDVTCTKEPSFEMVVRKLARNFFSPLCQTYYEKNWFNRTDFQLVLEAAVRELVDPELVAAHEGLLERLICESHDLAKEEKSFLPQIWELARPLFDGQKTRKTATYALETGRYNALIGHDEGTGTERAENFLRNWIQSTLDSITMECGDPCAIATEEKLTEVYAGLLNSCNEDGASIALPQRWACEALPPPEGWRSLVQQLIAAGVVTCRVRVQDRSEGKASGKGGKSSKGVKGPRSPAPPAASPAPSAVPGSLSAAFAWGKGQDYPERPAEPFQPPRRPSTAPHGEGVGLPSVYVRRRGNYGTGS